MTPQIYAIGLKGGLIEFRRSSKVPQVSSKVLTKTIQEPVGGGEWTKVPPTTSPEERSLLNRIRTDSPYYPVFRDWGNTPVHDRWMYLQREMRNVQDRIKLTTVRGGRRLGRPIKAALFSRWIGHSLSEGTVWKIPEEAASKVVQRLKDYCKRNK